MHRDRPSHSYVSAFQGKRDYYQVPLALAEVGRLAALFTDLYCPDVLVPIVRGVPGRVAEGLAGRRTDGLASRLVKTPLGAESMMVLGQHRLAGALGFDAARRLGRAAGRYTAKRGLGALVYSYNWAGHVEGLQERRPAAPQVVFHVHPPPRQVRSVLRQDRRATGFSTPAREEEVMTGTEVERHEEAVREADGVIVPSQFVARGVAEIGYSRSRIHVVPYGGDFSPRLSLPPGARRPDAPPLRLLSIGQLTYRKGLHHLVRAVADLSPDVSLTMVCHSAPDRDTVNPLPTNTLIEAKLTDDELASRYATHHAFVLPSLVEGFGLVYLEAMWFGQPVICTPNGGAADVITDGREGFVVPAGDVDALRRSIARLAADPGLAEEMGRNARRLAEGFTWERFRGRLRAALLAIEGNGRGRGSG